MGYLSGRMIYINNNYLINNIRFVIVCEFGCYLYKYKDNNDNSLKNLYEMIYESDVN